MSEENNNPWLIPGSLTQRLPFWIAVWWNRCRRIDSKRAGWRSVKNSVSIWERNPDKNNKQEKSWTSKTMP